MNNFSAVASIRFGCETFKKRPWFLIGISLLVLVLMSVFNPRGHGAPYLYTSIVDVVFFIVIVLVDMGFTAFLLKAEENIAAAKFSDLWHPYPFWKYLGTIIFSGILIVIGLFLLVIPGIALILMWMFVKYIVIARGLGPIEAMKESARITKGSRWELLALFVFVLVLNILGAIVFLVGLLVSIPITTLALVHAYRTLEKKAGVVASS